MFFFSVFLCKFRVFCSWIKLVVKELPSCSLAAQLVPAWCTGQPGGDMWGSWASSQGPMPTQSPATFIPFAPPPPSADTGTDSWPSLSPGYHQQLLLGDAPLLVSLPCRIHAGEHTLLLGSPYSFPWSGTSGGCTSTRPGSLSQCARDGAPS